MASDQEKFLERLRRLELQLERIANDYFFSESFADVPRGSFWQPPTDVYDTDTSVVVRMEAPGLDADDVMIVLRSNTLIVRAVRRDTHPGPKTVYHQLEIRYGLFERVVRLPEDIRHEEAAAEYADGFLVVTIPKSDTGKHPTDVVRLKV